MNESATVKLEEIMAPRLGAVDPSKYPDEIFDLYSIPAFDRREPEVVAGRNIGSTKQIVESGDVLLSKIVPHIRRSWIVGENRNRRIIASGEWIVFRDKQIHPEYLRQVLVGNPFHAQFMSTVSGVGGSLLRARPAYVSKIRIPLPPLPVQRRIAEILDRSETLRAKRRASLVQLDALTQSIFLDMFGDPVTNPKGWAVSRVGEVADVQGGLQVTSAREGHPHEAPYLRVANVFRGFLDLSEVKTIRATENEIIRTTLVKDDLLVVEGHGNPSEIGRAALWDGSILGCVHQNHIIRVRFEASKIIPIYACEFLNSPGGRRHLLRSGKTTSGLNTISVSEVRTAPLSLPPIGLQREFSCRITAVENLKATHCASLAELDALLGVLQYHAFRGEL